MSDGVHVFPCTAAVCNFSPARSFRGTPQMFRCFSSENKQNRGCFIQGRGSVKIRAGAPLDLSYPQTMLQSVLSYRLAYMLCLTCSVCRVLLFCVRVCWILVLFWSVDVGLCGWWPLTSERFKTLKADRRTKEKLAGSTGQSCQLHLLHLWFTACSSQGRSWLPKVSQVKTSGRQEWRRGEENKKKGQLDGFLHNACQMCRTAPHIFAPRLKVFCERRPEAECACWHSSADKCDRVGAEVKKTSSLGCEPEEDQSVSES